MKISYYTVGDIAFSSKIDASLYASNGTEDIKWHFFDNEFSMHNWKQEPPQTLDYLYKLRAENIRDNYDYVVILCSGGADSTNVLKTFLNNNILVDEIIASAPMSGLRDYQFNNIDTSHHNTISETIYTQIPLMQEIAINFPNIRITLNDYFGDIINYKSDKWILDCDDWIHPSSASRYRFEKHEHLRKLADNGKRICFVYGIDKPNLIIGKDNGIYITFSDHAVNVMRPPFDREYPTVDNVMFYWDITSLDCLTKQAHTLARWLCRPENSIAMSYVFNENSPPASYSIFRHRQSKYERAIVPCIYPTTHRPVFQAEKPVRLFLGEHDTWFYKLHKSTPAYEMLVSDTKHLFSKISSKFLNKGNNGFRMYSSYYKIGELVDFLG